MIRNSCSKYSKSFILLLGLLTSGCGSKDIYPTFSATGTVTLDGTPLAGAQVWLLPKSPEYLNAPIIIRPQGVTDSDGKFVLTTYYKDDGAPKGDFDIIVLFGDVDPDAETSQAKSKSGKKAKGPIVPHKYKDAKTSGLSTTINSSDNGITLDLKSK